MPEARCLSCNSPTCWRGQRGCKKPATCLCGGKLVPRLNHPETLRQEIEWARQGVAAAEADCQRGPQPGSIWTAEHLANVAACRRIRLRQLEERLAKVEAKAEGAK